MASFEFPPDFSFKKPHNLVLQNNSKNHFYVIDY